MSVPTLPALRWKDRSFRAKKHSNVGSLWPWKALAFLSCVKYCPGIMPPLRYGARRARARLQYSAGPSRGGRGQTDEGDIDKQTLKFQGPAKGWMAVA